MIKVHFKEFKLGMMEFGYNLSIIINSFLLFFVYFLGVGITSIIAKLFKKHFLFWNNKSKKSYWENLNLSKEKVERYYRQF